MENEEERIQALLTAVTRRVRLIADMEAKAALTKGYGARGEMSEEKLALLIERDRLLTRLEQIASGKGPAEGQVP